MKALSRRSILFVVIVLVTLMVLSIVLPPQLGSRRSGSTFSRAPDGYGAWFAFMQEQGVCIERWQSPFSDLGQNYTLLRVNSQLGMPYLSLQENDWVEKGNTLVVLGIWKPVTAAPFSTFHNTDTGSVKIETRRRHKLKVSDNDTNNDGEAMLSDRFGEIVWRRSIGDGQVIYATTPYLAANAYQDHRGNYQFLAQLVKARGGAILVDEYMHGYTLATRASQGEQPRTSPRSQDHPSGNRQALRDHRNSTCKFPPPQEIAPTDPIDWQDYLAKTPLLLVFVQLLILLFLLIWANNRRLGLPQPLVSPQIDNSTAYMQALATVLHKAECSEFVVDQIGKAEQLQLQRRLGLGEVLVDIPTLIQAWVQQTGQPATELESVLSTGPKRLNDLELLTWLKQWQSVRSKV
jgi:hypothetical protein